MTNLEATQAAAREGTELGDLRRNSNDAAQEGRYLRFTIAKLDIQQRWKNALLAGDEETAEAVRLEGERLCKAYYGVEE